MQNMWKVLHKFANRVRIRKPRVRDEKLNGEQIDDISESFPNQALIHP